MLHFDIISLFPEIMKGFFSQSIIARAIQKECMAYQLHNLKDYAIPSGKNKKMVDDYAFGGGAGMVLRPEPIASCLNQIKNERPLDEVIFVTPDGETLDQKMVNSLSLKKNLVILCGRYKGIDQRIRDKYVTQEISVGDYVLSGGELPAAILVDAITRVLPGVLNNETSALLDSFQGKILDAPVYTRPEEFEGLKVPEELLSGNHAAIEKWRYDKALEKTKQRRPDLLDEKE